MHRFALQSSSALPPYSDKAVLPQSVLSKIVDDVPESSLPHPLIFKLSSGGTETFIGVKEFSGSEDTIELPSSIKSLTGEEGTIELVSDVPKASALSLKPTQLYNVPNWKYFLENKLTKFFTTLTAGTTLVLEDDNLRYELIVESINQSSSLTACIIDTDIVLEVVPLDDNLAAEQLLEFTSNPHNNVVEVDTSVTIPHIRPFSDPKFVPAIYKVDLTRFSSAVFIELVSSDLHNTDVLVGLDKFINLEIFRNSTIAEAGDRKALRINIKDDDIVNKLLRVKEQEELGDSYDEINKWLYFIPFAWEKPADLTVNVREADPEAPQISEPEEIPPSTRQCSNCHKHIAQDKFVLHENFCLRNNVKCPQCSQVFFKQVPASHWHCGQCGFHADDPLLQHKHVKLFHSQPYTCSGCSAGVTFETFSELARHRNSDCAGKLHECRFCHLVVPQEEYSYQDRFENVTHHENWCGNKTSECPRCERRQRIKDLKKHMRMHELDKATMAQETVANYAKCANANCVQLVEAGAASAMGLCELCYGPLYVVQHDPSHHKLQARLERRYVLQLTRGCGNPWCDNQYCARGAPPPPIKEAMAVVSGHLLAAVRHPSLPVNAGRDPPASNTFWFCVNESVAHKKRAVDSLVAEAEYAPELILRAISTAGVAEARAWLVNNAVRRS